MSSTKLLEENIDVFCDIQEISRTLEDFRIQILRNHLLCQQEWEELTEKWNRRNQTPQVENLVSPCKFVWKPPDLLAEPILKEFLLREEGFPKIPRLRQTTFNCIEKPKKKDSTDKGKYDEKSEGGGSKSSAEEISTDEVEKEGYNSQTETTQDQPTFEQLKDIEDKIIIVQQNVRIEVPENRFSQEIHISDVGIGGVFCEASSNKNEKEITIVGKMDCGDVTDFHAITEMHNDIVKKENSSFPMSASLLEADAVEVIIQTPTSLEQPKIKCCFDYSKLPNIYLDDVNDMEQKSVGTMIENEHCSTAPNLVVFKMLKMEGYKGILYVFDPGGSRQFLLIMNYVDHVFTYPRAIIMELSYGVKKLSTSDLRSDEVDYWVGSKFCCFVLCTLKLRSVVEPPIPYFIEGVYLILGSVDDEGTLNIVGLNSCNGNTISERVYRRASLVFRNQTNEKVVCLRCYVFYLARENRKEEEMIELEGTLGKSDAVNRELISLERKLSTQYKTNSINAFILYVYSLVLKEEGNEILARTVLVKVVNGYLWNWSAWYELQTLYTKIEALSNLQSNIHRRKEFFLAKAYYELRLHKESLKKYENLQGTFSCSNYIQCQIAKAQYNFKEFEQVKDISEGLLRNDFYRIEDMDMYSNVLYAKECFSTFSYLAYRVFMTDKYGSESYSIIGNYYSLKGHHENSVKYFRQDIRLNKKCLSVWILMSHECVEKKNTTTAIGACQGAVDIIPWDFQAWYGLGQAYEMIFMPFYALAYLKKSTFLQPFDFRLWIAMAQYNETEQNSNV